MIGTNSRPIARLGRSHLVLLACAAAGAAAVVGVAVTARRLLSPYRALPADSLRLFVGDCLHSQRAYRALAADPTAAPLVTPLPLVDPASNLGRQICDRTLPIAERQRPLVGWLPTRLACRWLSEDAAAFHRRHFIHLPAWSLGEQPVPMGDEHRVLAAHGLVRRR